MKNLKFHVRITEIMNILEFHTRITKIMNIIELQWRIVKIMKVQKIPLANHANPENPRMQCDN